MNDTVRDPSAKGTGDAVRAGAATLRRAVDRLAGAAHHLVRQGNRRRLTLRGRGGELWLRLPLTLAVVIVLVAAIHPLAPLALVLIVVLATGGQLSVERVAADLVGPPGEAPPPRGAA